MTEPAKTPAKKSPAKRGKKAEAAAPAPAPVAAATKPLADGSVVLSPQQVQGIQQLASQVMQPGVAWNPDVEPIAMANAIIKNNRNMAQAILETVERAKQGQ